MLKSPAAHMHAAFVSQDGVFVLDNGPYSGIFYEDIEVFTFNLGDGVDDIVSQIIFCTALVNIYLK